MANHRTQLGEKPRQSWPQFFIVGHPLPALDLLTNFPISIPGVLPFIFLRLLHWSQALSGAQARMVRVLGLGLKAGPVLLPTQQIRDQL